MHYIHSFVDIYEHIGIWGYWAVFFVALFESLAFVGAFVPGALIVLSVGFACSNGILNFSELVWFVAAGAIVGDTISYYLGTHGRKFFKSHNRFLKDSYLETGKRFFEKYGNKSIFLGRFIGPLRPVVPFIAGLSHMPKRDFLIWNIISGFMWSLTFLLLGYFFGSTIKTLEFWITRSGALVVILSIILISIWLVFKRGREIFRFLKSMHVLALETFISNTLIKKINNSHPKLTRFLKKRFKNNTILGLPLTFSSIVILCTILFIFIQDNILAISRIIFNFDQKIGIFLATYRSSFLTEVFYGFTFLGNFRIVSLVICLMCGCFIIYKKKIYIAPFLFTIFATELFTRIFKLFFHRVRPGKEIALYVEHSFSFPSGHSSIAIALYGFIIYFIITISKNKEQKILSLVLGVFIITAIGFSRMYLGVHYLSDVLGGYLLGFFWLIIGIVFVGLLKILRKLF